MEARRKSGTLAVVIILAGSILLALIALKFRAPPPSQRIPVTQDAVEPRTVPP